MLARIKSLRYPTKAFGNGGITESGVWDGNGHEWMLSLIRDYWVLLAIDQEKPIILRITLFQFDSGGDQNVLHGSAAAKTRRLQKQTRKTCLSAPVLFRIAEVRAGSGSQQIFSAGTTD